MSIEQLARPGSMTVIPYELSDHKGVGINIRLLDETLITMERRTDKAELLWPTLVGAKEFLIRTACLLGVVMPEEVDLIRFGGLSDKIPTATLAEWMEVDTGLEFHAPEANIHISWVNNSFNPSSTPEGGEGGIAIPDLYAVDLPSLFGATGSDMVHTYQLELVEQILHDHWA